MIDYCILSGLATMVAGVIWLKYSNDHERKEAASEFAQGPALVTVKDGGPWRF